jgi:hypothetical protein
MTTLDDLRTIVRTQTQTSNADLPDPTIDVYLQQAFERTVNGETLWPFYEQTWQLTLTAGKSEMDLAGDVNQAGIMALYDTVRNFRLQMVGHETADDHFVGPQVGTTVPVMFSLWGGKVVLWPRSTLSTDHTYMLRGYRRPLVWLTTANEPDCDARLHMALSHYAVALAYAQQEDDQLELTYMDRWQRDAEAARRAIMDPRHHRPLAYASASDSFPASVNAWSVVPPT